MPNKMKTTQSKQSLDVVTSPIDSLARRRMLLNGLGKGSVVVAAASVPLHTLAGTQTRCKTDGQRGEPVWATCSGFHSPCGSRAPQDTPVAQGCGQAHYVAPTNWPGYNSNQAHDTSCLNKKFCTVFGGSSGGIYAHTCHDIVINHSTTPQCRWVLAYLNSQTCQGKNYPYEPTEVVQLYQCAGTSGFPARTDCETFFGQYMETCA